jgi:hypothetical protein
MVFDNKARLIRRIISFSLITILYSTSCHQKVDWLPADFEPKPTVSSVIRSGEPIIVKISLAVAFSAQAHPEIDNALVLLYVDNEYVETLEYIGDGLYQSEHEAQEEREYRCEVTIPSHKTAICSTYIPKQQNLIKFEHINKAGVDEEGLTYPAVRVTFENKPNQTIYYEVVIYLFKHEEVSHPLLLNIADPVLLNEGLPLAVFSNELIEGSTYTMTINYSTGSASNYNNTGWVTNLYPVQVELRSICYHYYNFIKQQYLYEQSNSDPIFSVGATPTYNLHSNVENGYGIFAGYSSVKSEIIYP